jgi:hypothetical protein
MLLTMAHKSKATLAGAVSCTDLDHLPHDHLQATFASDAHRVILSFKPEPLAWPEPTFSAELG